MMASLVFVARQRRGSKVLLTMISENSPGLIRLQLATPGRSLASCVDDGKLPRLPSCATSTGDRMHLGAVVFPAAKPQSSLRERVGSRQSLACADITRERGSVCTTTELE